MGLRQANKSGFPAHDEDAEDTDAVFISRDDISDYNPGQILPEPPDVVEEIRAWLQPTAYDIAGGEYRKHLSSHVAGTGNWLTSTESYQKWLGSDEHGLLWITGIPGSGKSVMAAKLIDELAKSNPGSAVLFFFFRQIIDANHKPQALLRDWMDQILSHSPPLQKQLKAHVDDRRSLESVSMEDMWKHLRLALACLPGKVFCVADALDEMDQGHEEFLKALAELGRWRPKTVKVLITSRTVPSVEGPLRKSPCLRIRLQETLVDMDISTYVHHALSRSNIPRGDWHVIADAVPGRANGLFLYAKLAMDAFLEPGVDIRTALSRLPTDLNALYTDLLDEHAKRSGVPESIQRLILQSVTHATRPLRLLELAEMIRVGRPDGATRDIKATKNVIRAACGPLLEILPDETVSVIHHSFTEYLKGMTRSGDSPHMGYPVLQAGPTHARLASQCLLYLQAGCLGSVKIGSSGDGHGRSYDDYEIPEQEVQLRLRYPFFEYAASNWHRHIAKSEAAGHDQAGTNAKLHEVFGDGKNRDAWLQMRWPVKAAGNRLVTQLHIAAKTGLISYAKELLKSIDANTRDEYDRTPVWWAAAGGNAEVIDALIEAGADPDQPDNLSGVRPLHNAASGNHSAAVTALLKAGVDPLTPKTLEDPGIRCGNAPSTVGDSPLMYASSGHIEALEAFLPFIGDDIALVHRALAWAASAGSTKAATRLLRHPGVNVDAVVDGQTPLYRACSTVDADMVAVFLRAGADPNIRCDVSGGRALPWTSEEEEDPSKLNCLYELCNNSGDDGCDEKLEIILPLLIQAGIDIHYRTPSGESALHAATRSPVLVRLLLEAGLDANATDCHGAAALHRLDASGDSAMLSMALLVEQGHADINAANADGQTPLRCLLSSCNSECILRFLEYGPDCNARDNNGNNALHVVMQHNGSNLEVINALLKRGADPNARNHEQLVPLLYLTQADRNFTGIVQAFVEAGADIHAADRDGNTLFFRLLSGYTYLRETESHSELKYLVDRGHSPSQRNFHGHTALHLAVKHHSSSEAYGGPWNLNMSRLDFLISLNLDVKAVDYGGNSLLHVLAMRRDNHYSFDGVRLIALWEKLLALGLNLEQKNHSGRTPLHILCTARTRSLRLEPGSVMPIDFVLSRVKNVDLPDVDGITPLHIAVTRGELYAKKLIDAGANPLVHTYEGLTPLHLAARCRDGNAVGLLLGALRRRQEEMSTAVANISRTGESDSLPFRKKTANSKAVMGVNAEALDKKTIIITPLFYACRSGRPETVALLLEAGADVKIGNIFDACLDFEAECELWKLPRSPEDGEERLLHKLPLKLADACRDAGYNYSPPSSGGPCCPSPGDTARLEEIVGMLVSHGADVSQLSGYMKTAVTKNRDYTAACLRSIIPGRRPTGSDAKESMDDDITKLSETTDHYQKQASIEALISSKVVDPGDREQAVALTVVARLLIRREYHLVEELARLGAGFLHRYNTRDNSCGLSHLVRLGFASLVEKIGSLEAESMLQKGDWHAFGDATQPGLWHARRDSACSYPRPFIFDAVQRDLPNMHVLRLLVEKFAVNVNELDDSKESALFCAARGNNWWVVHQALPYLLDAGADIHVRNVQGQTPLHMALEGDSNWPGPYNWDAAKILIGRGADVNAVDGKGRSCLACAQHNVDMVKLLIKHGATVTVDSIFAAIDSGNAQVVEALLSGGMDPNTGRDGPPEPSSGMTGRGHKEPDVMLPLYHAAMKLNRPWRFVDKDHQEIAQRAKVVQVLLGHGADPFAKFLKRDAHAEEGQGYRECTLLHEVLFAGKLADEFLQLSDLDVNHRDAKGRTLLHMVCESSNGPDYIIGSYAKNPAGVRKERVHTFQRLLSLGAELKAQDDFGRNILHYMFIGEVNIGSSTYEKLLAYTLDKAPDLSNQADGNGETPLHYAAIRAVSNNNADEVRMLLDAGAHPTAVNKKGDTMLHILGRGLAIAVLRNSFQDLVGRGVDINARNDRGETALFSFYGLPKAGRNSRHHSHGVDTPTAKHAKPMLEKLGGDFLVTDSQGRGLLHAAASGDVERFQELMDMGLDPMMEDYAQQTAIDKAAACGNRDILELFEKKDEGNPSSLLGT